MNFLYLAKLELHVALEIHFYQVEVEYEIVKALETVFIICSIFCYYVNKKDNMYMYVIHVHVP